MIKLPTKIKLRIFLLPIGWIAALLLPATIFCYLHYYANYNPYWEEIKNASLCQQSTTISLQYKSQGFDDESNKYWWEARYTYSLEDAPHNYEGYSYLKTRIDKKEKLPHFKDQKAPLHIHKINPNISILHLPGNKVISNSNNPKTFIIGSICFVMALFFGGIAWFKASRIYQLLENGILTKGKVVHERVFTEEEHEITSLWFSFPIVNGKQFRASYDTPNPSVLKDDKEEFLLYNPKKPTKIMPVDTQSAIVKNWILANKKSIV